MRKFLFMLGLTVLLSFSLGSVTVAATPTATITYLGRGGEPERLMYQEIFEAFMAENPDIHVEMVWTAGDAHEILERMLVMTASGVAPDVFWLHSYHTAQVAEMGLLYPLDAFRSMSGEIDWDDLFPAALSDFSYQGRLLGLPRETSSVVLYYNQELFDQAGLSYPDMELDWAGVVDAARKLTRVEGDQVRYGMIAPTGHGFDLAVVWQNEGRVLTDDRRGATFSSPAVVEAYEWIMHLMTEAEVAPRADVPFDPVANFRNDRVAMVYNIRGFATQIGQEGRWDVAHLPAGKTHATRIASSGHAIHNETQNVEAAWRLLQYLTGPTAQSVFARGGLSIPALRSVALSDAFIDPAKMPESDLVFLESLSYARSEPVTTAYFDLVGRKNAALAPMWRGELPVAQALEALDAQLNALLRD